ncbi:MAG TPA: glycoside hydrolase family 97 catalytic domain-containing protein, partial [Bacteroidales bacterium]
FQSNSITKENTTFNLTQPFIIYQYNHESIFTPTAIDTLSKTCDFPATIHTGKLYFSIGEAENKGYTKAELKKGDAPNSLAVAFPRDKEVKTGDAFQTPWRTISIARTAIGLHDYSELFLKLTQSSLKEIPTWIKPGKLIRSQLTTQSGLECIDFAVKHDFQYIMFDAGWYGAEFRSISDPTQVIPQIDMPKVIQYGKEKGIGVILYVNYVGLRAKLDTILPLFKQWGISGMKFGFVDGITQNGLTWLVSAIKKANDYGFVIDIHDNYKPTGLSRIYPALLTQEGIRGDENSPDAFHTTVLPFTRFLAGPADFTFCYPNKSNSYSKNMKVSNAQQLALTVVYFSPLQAMFWYGKPTEYTNEEEIEFFKYVPTVWNESHYLAGDIGKNISVARRKGDTWFVGNVAGFEDWNSNVQLDFLTKGKAYTATVYEDDGAGSIRKRTKQVKKGDTFPFEIKAKGGQAIILRSE